MKAVIPADGGEGIAQVALRMPVSLRQSLKEEARAEGRSMNMHIVMCLKKRNEGVQLEQPTP